MVAADICAGGAEGKGVTGGGKGWPEGDGTDGGKGAASGVEAEKTPGVAPGAEDCIGE